MATTSLSELEAFHRFLGEPLTEGQYDLSVEESLAAFRAHQQEIQQLREELRPALQESARGESQPLDVEQLKDQVTQALSEKGISQ